MKILFMCVANSARSQLAEGLARAAFPGARVESAGSRPGKLNPYAVAVMKEIGLDISSHRSKAVEDLPAEFVATVDCIVTLCAEEVCPIVNSPARRIHWPLPDPASEMPLLEEEMLRRFRAARDAISEKLETLKGLHAP